MIVAFIANSDFHKPKHIYSWKTLVNCEKDPEAIKQCIRTNEHTAITLYRDGLSGASLKAEFGHKLKADQAMLEFPLAVAASS